MRRVSAAFSDHGKAREVLSNLKNQPQLNIKVHQLSGFEARVNQQDVGQGILYGTLIGTFMGIMVGLVAFLAVGGALSTLLLVSSVLGLINGAVIGSVLEAVNKKALIEQCEKLRKNGALLIEVQTDDVLAETEAHQQFTHHQGVILQTK